MDKGFVLSAGRVRFVKAQALGAVQSSATGGGCSYECATTKP